MLINKQNKIHCFWCNKDYSFDEIFLHYLFGSSVTCPFDHLLGYEWELFSCEYYYIYHKQGYCRCIQDKCDCWGNENKCKNPEGKESYEQDLEEEK